MTPLPGGAFRITRASGSLSFPAGSYFANRILPLDFDGDGRSDLIDSSTGASPGVYIVLGRTADGPVHLAADGIRIPAQLVAPQLVGDQTGDGRPDVAAYNLSAGHTEIYSGADLVAPGPGAAFAGMPARSLDGELLGVVPFDGSRPVLVTSADARVGGQAVTLDLHGNPTLVLTTAGSGIALSPNGDGYVTSVHGVLDEGRVWLVLGQSSRSGSDVWAWQLDDLCQNHSSPQPRPTVTAPPSAPANTTPAPPASSAPPAATPPPAAPPAPPVRGSASFTG